MSKKKTKKPTAEVLEVEYFQLPIVDMSLSYFIRFRKPVDFTLDVDPIKVYSNKEDHDEVFKKNILERFHKTISGALEAGESAESEFTDKEAYKKAINYLHALKKIKEVKLIEMEMIKKGE